MSPIGLELSLHRRDVLHGEALDVKVSLANRGDAPVQVHRSFFESPFVFNLLSPEDRRVLHSFSRARHSLAMTPNKVVIQPPEMVELFRRILEPSSAVMVPTALSTLIPET